MANKYIIADGFIVNGKSGGESLKFEDVENMQILLESGRVFVESSKSSGTMKPQQPIGSSEEE